MLPKMAEGSAAPHDRPGPEISGLGQRRLGTRHPSRSDDGDQFSPPRAAVQLPRRPNCPRDDRGTTTGTACGQVRLFGGATGSDQRCARGLAPIHAALAERSVRLRDGPGDLLDRYLSVPVQDRVPATRLGCLDVCLVVIKEDDFLRLDAEPLPGKAENCRIRLS